MFETILLLFAALTTVLLVRINNLKLKQINKQLREFERVTDKTRAMCVSGEHLNKKKEILLEVQGAHVAGLEEEHNTWRSRRKDYEAVITKQRKDRKKKIRGKKRKGR